MIISDLFESENNKDFGAAIYHGSRDLDIGVYPKQKLREKPSSTFLPVHKMMSVLSKEKFGIDIRSLTFASMDVGKTQPYGPALIMIPLGNRYRVFVNDGVTDMTMKLGVGTYDVRNKIMSVLQTKVYEDFVNDEVLFSANDVIRDIHNGKIEADNLEEVYYKVQDALKEVLKKQGHEDFLENGFKVIMEEVANHLHEIERDVKAYIEGIKEAKSASDIENKGSELMLYMPDGFELKDLP